MERTLSLRRRCVAEIEKGLRAACQDPTALMTYERYETDIVLFHGVEITWPDDIPFKSPAEQGMSLPFFSKFARLLGLIGGQLPVIKWVRLSTAELQQREEEYLARREAADAVQPGPSSAKRKTSGVTHQPRQTDARLTKRRRITVPQTRSSAGLEAPCVPGQTLMMQEMPTLADGGTSTVQ